MIKPKNKRFDSRLICSYKLNVLKQNKNRSQGPVIQQSLTKHYLKNIRDELKNL